MSRETSDIPSGMSVDTAMVVLREYRFDQEKKVFSVPLSPALRLEAVAKIMEAQIDDVIVRTSFGQLMWLTLSADFFIQRYLLRDGEYEPALGAVLRCVLRPGDIFVDVGANIGVHSILAGTCVGPTGHIIAFEPNPIVARRLAANAAINALENIRIEPFAAGDRLAKFKLIVNSYNLGSGTLYSPEEVTSERLKDIRRILVEGQESQILRLSSEGKERKQKDPEALIFDVEMRPWTELLSSSEVARLKAVKIDVEGSEEPIVNFGHSLWDADTPPIVIVEYIENRAGYRQHLFDSFHARGWSMFIVSATEERAPVFNRLSEPYVAAEFENLIAIPPCHLNLLSGYTVFEYPHEEMRKKYGYVQH